MSFLQGLMEQRRKFLDGLDANQGDINLDIFEDFYPDQAHFVFELLQNAEDTGATAVEFTLTAEGCSFVHNGTRTFTEGDVRSITGIHNSTKTKSSNQIGKFGVGFKSVFVYTQTPTIYSGDFSFRIVQLVMPEPVPADRSVGAKTKFWLPFNNPKKHHEAAFTEINAGLSELAETTILFLPNIESIKWRVKDDVSGELLRVSHSENHIEILKQINGETTTSAHFLRFSAPVTDLPRQHVAVAFVLDFLPNVPSFSADVPLSQQMRIVAATPGQVAVYFPAAKETSNLRFHLHAPFVPDLSRAVLKDNSPANLPLFAQLATLTAASLHAIRDQGLLTTDFLGVLPNPQDQLGPRYAAIRSAVIAAMNAQPLTPTYAKGHAPAKDLVQAKAVLKELLSPEDIAFLIDHDDHPPQWAASRALQGTLVERFMTGLNIQDWDVEAFIEHIDDKASEGYGQIDADFMRWLGGKSIEWHQQFYALLARDNDAQGDLHRLQRCKIVRLTDGAYSVGKKCHFPDDEGRAPASVPCVDPATYRFGKSKSVQEAAEKFLKDVNVTHVGERQLVEALLRNAYKNETKTLNEREYTTHLRRLMKLVEAEPTSVGSLIYFNILLGSDGKWHRPVEIYLDAPFVDTGLSEYFEVSGTPTKLAPLADIYQNLKVDRTKFVGFCKALGCIEHIRLNKVSCRKNPKWSYLSNVPGDRETSPIDADFEIAAFSKLVERGSERLARLIWNTMLALPNGGSAYNSAYSGYVLMARYRKSHSRGERSEDSLLVHQLRSSAWVPQRGGTFVRPAEARAGLLPEGFTYDQGWPWIKAIRFGQDIQLETEKAKAEAAAASERDRRDRDAAKTFGFANATMARELGKVPEEELQSFLAERERRMSMELPDNESGSPDRRAAGVTAQAVIAPERRTEERVRSVSVGREGVKAEADQYLRQQYTRDDFQFCQICKDRLPFKLDTGDYYFETVEFLPELNRRHPQNYLCLCPNHAAMFQHANGSKSTLRESILKQVGNDCPVTLARKDRTIYFTGIHLADLQAIIRADQNDEQQADAPDSLKSASS